MSIIVGSGSGWILVEPRNDDLPLPAETMVGRRKWSDVVRRERDFSTADDFILIHPCGHIDRRLRLYLRSMAFDGLARTSKSTYALSIRTWLDFGYERGIEWTDATEDDLSWFKRWRLDLSGREGNPNRVEGATWNKDVYALESLYSWATDKRRSFSCADPLPRSIAASRVKNPALSKDAKRDRTRWVVPATARFYRDVGLRGYGVELSSDDRYAATAQSSSFRGRNVSRNVAFFDLTYSTALRRAEAGSLLSIEVPDSRAEVPLAAATAKGGKVRHYVLQGAALAGVQAYMRIARRAAIRRARKAGRYDNIRIDYVTRIEARRRGGLTLIFEDGSTRAVSETPPDVRARLFADMGNGFEPLSLWLSEDGLPMERKSWDDVFETANKRLARHMMAAGADLADVPVLSPHSLRSSFALWVLAALHRRIDEQDGTPPTAPYDERRYLSAFETVQDLLGHASVETTRNHYLEPVKGVRRAIWAEDRSEIEQMLSSLAASDPRVSDIAAR